AEGGLDREMGDRMSAALADPRAVDKAGLEAVIEEQSQQLGDDGERVPRMRLHTAISKRGKNVGKETWTLYIEDRRGESGRAERRKRTSALSTDFTPEGARAFFDYHQQQEEQEHERSARQAEAAELAERIAAAARQSGDDGGVDLDPRRRRGAEREARPAGRAAEEARGVREGHGGGDEAAGADHGPGVNLLALQRRVREDREYREQAERDREHARRVRAESQRRELKRRVAELGRGGAEEPRGYGIGDGGAQGAGRGEPEARQTGGLGGAADREAHRGAGPEGRRAGHRRGFDHDDREPRRVERTGRADHRRHREAGGPAAVVGRRRDVPRAPAGGGRHRWALDGHRR